MMGLALLILSLLLGGSPLMQTAQAGAQASMRVAALRNHVVVIDTAEDGSGCEFDVADSTETDGSIRWSNESDDTVAIEVEHVGVVSASFTLIPNQQMVLNPHQGSDGTIRMSCEVSTGSD